MDVDGWLAVVANVRRWSRAGKRAPHQPLLLLFALGRLQRSGSSRVSFAEAEPVLQALLDEFGPTRRKTTPVYLSTTCRAMVCGVVTNTGGLEAGTNLARLRVSATGALAADFEAALRADPRLAALIARRILDGEFPESLHAEICAVAGLDVEALELTDAVDRAVRLEEIRRRSATFRDDVLVAYEYRCAVCGFDGQLERQAVGLDAAHVRWWAFDGPDAVDNGVCLCALHHKLFDRGAIGISTGLTVMASRRFVGRGPSSRELVLSLVDRPLGAPQPGDPPPGLAHVRWHAEQVFRGPALSSVAI